MYAEHATSTTVGLDHVKFHFDVIPTLAAFRSGDCQGSSQRMLTWCGETTSRAALFLAGKLSLTDLPAGVDR